jgi:hypothetical protein
MEMRDPVWFREFEREYNEREDRLDEIREQTRKFREESQESKNERLQKHLSLWRKRNIHNKDMEYSKKDDENHE